MPLYDVVMTLKNVGLVFVIVYALVIILILVYLKRQLVYLQDIREFLYRKIGELQDRIDRFEVKHSVVKLPLNGGEDSDEITPHLPVADTSTMYDD